MCRTTAVIRRSRTIQLPHHAAFSVAGGGVVVSPCSKNKQPYPIPRRHHFDSTPPFPAAPQEVTSSGSRCQVFDENGVRKVLVRGIKKAGERSMYLDAKVSFAKDIEEHHQKRLIYSEGSSSRLVVSESFYSCKKTYLRSGRFDFAKMRWEPTSSIKRGKSVPRRCVSFEDSRNTTRSYKAAQLEESIFNWSRISSCTTSPETLSFRCHTEPRQEAR